MSPKRMMINRVESRILNHEKFSKNYELSTLIYSNKNFYLYTIINKETRKKYFLEVNINRQGSCDDYLEKWQMDDYNYFIKE
jgi:hypothetical protein